MTDRTNLDIVKEGYTAFGRGDIPGLLSVMDENVSWYIPESAGVPWAGLCTGHDGLKGFFSRLAADVDFEAFEPRTFVANGNQVVVLGFEKCRVKRTGRTFEAQWAHVFTLSGGKVASFQEYTDTAAVAEAHREQVAA